MLPQEYEIVQFQAGDFKDKNGNVWCNLALAGVSEPLRIVVKDPAAYKVGDRLYGHMELKTSQAGKAYQRFYRDQRPQQGVPVQAGQVVANKYQPRDDDAIRAQFAIKAAVAACSNSGVSHLQDPMAKGWENSVEAIAVYLYNMVDRVKGSNSGSAGSREVYSSPKPTQVSQNPETATVHADDKAIDTYQRTVTNEYNYEDIPEEYR